MRPGILLDRDGTINHDYHYVGHPERFQFIDGVPEAIARFNRAGIPVAIITNQSGVARGFYTENHVYILHERMQLELQKHGAHADLILYSPHHPEGHVPGYAEKSDRHKPNIGMATEAAQALDLDLAESWVVGDRLTDMELASRIRSNGVFLGPDPVPYYMSHFYRFASLADAAGLIIERITGMPQSSFPTMNYTGMTSFFTHYTDEIGDVISRISASMVAQAADMVLDAFASGSTVFTAGNGGAASVALHFECHDTIPQSRIFNLNSNVAVLTATANDVGYDAIFSHQLERWASEPDVLLTFSVSGNSNNIVRAIQCANELNVRTIAIVAKDGGQAAKLASVSVHIPTGNYGVAEDVMSIIMHSIYQFARQYRMTDQQVRSATF
jgi:D-sedoheptulose 7-phosphate isomerase/D-glycero-D-manno-heptose 1,7-bisphosphate phosphatase